MLKQWYDKTESWLDGETDGVITLLLFLTIAVGVIIALFGPKLAKVGLILYWWFPSFLVIACLFAYSGGIIA